MTTEYQEWMTVEQAGEILDLGPRMVNRYGNPPYNKLPTQRRGRRVLYHRDDVLTLAEELEAARLVSPPVKTELATIPDVTERTLELEHRLYAAAEEIGRLKGLLERVSLGCAEAGQNRAEPYLVWLRDWVDWN